MPLRLYSRIRPQTGQRLELDTAASRHAQVRRLQPGDALRLFDGRGGQWQAAVVQMGRQVVVVDVGVAEAVNTELPLKVTLAVGMPANERMDWLVEKATELGVTTIQPLHCERSVLRLEGERAERRGAHWQAIAVTACEQSARATLPAIEPPLALNTWLRQGAAPGLRLLLSTQSQAPTPQSLPLDGQALVALSGPEGGLTATEEAAAIAAGFAPISLGPRVLRAETAPLALLAYLALRL